MIVPKEELVNYLGNDLAKLEDKVSANTLKKLRDYDPPDFTLPVIDYLFLSHQRENRSLTSLSKDIGISLQTLRRVFSIYGLPKLGAIEAGQRIWQDPEFRERKSEAIRKRWEDPEYRERRSEETRKQWEDPEFREMKSEATRKLWEDPEFREKQAEAIRKVWEDPEFRKRISEGSKRIWQDPEFREKQAEGTRKLWENPEYRKRGSEAIRKQWKDPEFREKQAEGTRKLWENPEYRKRGSEAIRKLREDPEFREKQAEGIRKLWENPEYREKQAEAIRKLREDPEFREKQAEAIRKLWEDPEFREARRKLWEDPEYRKRQAEAIRKARLNPENIGRYHLPTIQGYRQDIGYNASSAWEANLARVLMYCGREWYTGESFRIQVTDKYKQYFNSDVTQMIADFVVKDPRGNTILYELMAHPFEDPKGYAKLEMLILQYPRIKVKMVTGKVYYRLKNYFEEKINSVQFLNGWETEQDNLRTNPAKYK